MKTHETIFLLFSSSLFYAKMVQVLWNSIMDPASSAGKNSPGRNIFFLPETGIHFMEVTQ